MGLDSGYLKNLKKSIIGRMEIERISTAKDGRIRNYWHGCMAAVRSRCALCLGVVCSYKT